MKPSIEQGSPGAEMASPDAHADDDARLSIETVIASLGSRSNAEREALLKALLDGENEPHRPPHGASSQSRIFARLQNVSWQGAFQLRRWFPRCPFAARPARVGFRIFEASAGCSGGHFCDVGRAALKADLPLCALIVAVP